MTMYVVSDGHFGIRSLFPDEQHRGPFDLVIANIEHRVAVQMLNEEGRRGGHGAVLFYVPRFWAAEFSEFLTDVHIGMGPDASPQLSHEHVFVVVRRRLREQPGDPGWLWYTVTCF